METKTSVLLKISEGRKIIVPKTSGQRTLAQAKAVFTGHLDPDFKKWGTDIKGEPKPETPADVYEQIENATFAEMFTSLSSDLGQLLWEQKQIIVFVENHKNWLHPEGYGSFLGFKVKDEVFVAHVRLFSGGALIANVHRFGIDYVWFASLRRRVIVPQLAA